MEDSLWNGFKSRLLVPVEMQYCGSEKCCRLNIPIGIREEPMQPSTVNSHRRYSAGIDKAEVNCRDVKNDRADMQLSRQFGAQTMLRVVFENAVRARSRNEGRKSSELR